jgi:hypothetical protein
MHAMTDSLSQAQWLYENKRTTHGDPNTGFQRNGLIRRKPTLTFPGREWTTPSSSVKAEKIAYTAWQ